MVIILYSTPCLFVAEVKWGTNISAKDFRSLSKQVGVDRLKPKRLAGLGSRVTGSVDP